MSVPIPRIVCEQHSLEAAQWCAWREDNPFRRSCGDHAAAALRRFLEFNTAGELAFDLQCDRDLVGDGRTLYRMRWSPPELFLECHECNGSGSYTGLLTTEPCQSCEGQGSRRILC